MDYSRRVFIAGAAGLLASAAIPGMGIAKAPGNKKYVLVILRGGMDGLAAVAPYGDRDYERARGGIALPDPNASDGVIRLDRLFGLHPAMEPLHALYEAGELAFFHAVASPYRSRSHFDAQDILENGMHKASASRQGWLNRALQEMGASEGDALAFGNQVPLVLAGDMRVSSWAQKRGNFNTESSFMDKVKAMYQHDEQLGVQLEQGLQAEEVARTVMEDVRANRGAVRPNQFSGIARAAGGFLMQPHGPNIVTLEVGGWDTHANQGQVNGSLANRLGNLANGIAQLRDMLDSEWKHTVINVVTEFGRTVKQNGTGGTDHGIASVAIVAGGGVNGGKVYGKWPGLSEKDLYQGRDLQPTTDIRSIFKTVLRHHFGMREHVIDQRIFPDANNARPMWELMRGV